MQQLLAICRSGGARMGTFLRAFLRDDGAQDLLEYAFLAAFIGVAGFVALNAIGPTIGTVYATWIDPNTAGSVPSLWDPCYLLSTGACAAGS
jgi:Flp pilus assembly pilin Flp